MTPRRIFIGLLFLLILAAAAAVLSFANAGNYQRAQAVLRVSSGSATILHPDKTSVSVSAGASGSVGVGDQLRMAGRGALTFASAQIDLEKDSQLTLKTYVANGTESQIDLLMDAGPIYPHVAGYSDSHSRFTITTPTALISTRSAEFIIWLTQSGATEVGMFSGTASVSKPDGSAAISLKEGQGTVLASGGTPVARSWSKVRVLLYRPDGSAVNMPVSLISNLNSEMYTTASGQLVMLPTGSYSVKVDLLVPYIARDLTLDPDKINDLSVTLSEIKFSTVNTDQTSAVNKLLVRLAGKVDAISITTDQWVLISPGTWLLAAAPANNPQAWQTLKVDLMPGQQVSTALPENMFGAGSIAVNIVAPKEANVGAVDVWVYNSGEESTDPILTFKADGSPQTLSQGNYVISVRTKIAFRQEITIGRGEARLITVQVGALAINYSDNQNKPLSRDLYIASTSEMNRLKMDIKLMNRTPYGVWVKTNVQLWLPVGVYSLLVDESPDITRDNITVTAGQTTAIDLKAS